MKKENLVFEFHGAFRVHAGTDDAKPCAAANGGAPFRSQSTRPEAAVRYPIQRVGGAHHTEWWVPAEDLEELNRNIVGKIEVIKEFRASP